MTLNSKECKVLMNDFLTRKKNTGKPLYIAQLYYRLNKLNPGLDRSVFRQLFKDLALLGEGEFMGANRFKPKKSLPELAREVLGRETVGKTTNARLGTPPRSGSVLKTGNLTKVGNFSIWIDTTDSSCPAIKFRLE